MMAPEEHRAIASIKEDFTTLRPADIGRRQRNLQLLQLLLRQLDIAQADSKEAVGGTPHRRSTKNLRLHISALPPLGHHFLNQLADGDIAIFRGGQAISIPQREEIMIHAADGKAGIPKADCHTRPEDSTDHHRLASDEDFGRKEVAARQIDYLLHAITLLKRVDLLRHHSR